LGGEAWDGAVTMSNWGKVHGGGGFGNGGGACSPEKTARGKNEAEERAEWKTSTETRFFTSSGMHERRRGTPCACGQPHGTLPLMLVSHEGHWKILIQVLKTLWKPIETWFLALDNSQTGPSWIMVLLTKLESYESTKKLLIGARAYLVWFGSYRAPKWRSWNCNCIFDLAKFAKSKTPP
jgi:hypothetical protein